MSNPVGPILAADESFRIFITLSNDVLQQLESDTQAETS